MPQGSHTLWFGLYNMLNVSNVFVCVWRSTGGSRGPVTSRVTATNGAAALLPAQDISVPAGQSEWVLHSRANLRWPRCLFDSYCSVKVSFDNSENSLGSHEPRMQTEKECCSHSKSSSSLGTKCCDSFPCHHQVAVLCCQIGRCHWEDQISSCWQVLMCRTCLINI